MTLAVKPSAPVLQSNQYATGLLYFAVMYEGSGTTLHDLSTNTNNATVASIWGTGQFSGPDLNIATTSGNVVIQPTRFWSVTPGSFVDFSVSTWVKLTSPTTSQYFAAQFAPSTNAGFAIGCDDAGSGKAKIYTNRGAPFTFLSTSALSANTWHHVVGTISNGGSATSTLKLYIDGVLDGTGSQDSPSFASNSTQYPTIGGIALTSSTGQLPTAGQIDAVAIYNYVLPASGGSNDSVAGIFADPFRAVRPPAAAGSGAALLAAL